MPEERPVEVPLGGRVFTGGVVITAASWTGKLARFVMFLLLARLLSIEEFGVAAALGVLIGMQTLIDTLGFQSALVQQSAEPTRDELNTAWTLDNLCVRLSMGLIYLTGGPLIAQLFGLGSMTEIVQLIAVIAFVRALENSAIVILLRRLDYLKRSALQIADSLVTVSVVLALLAAGETQGWIVVAGAIAGTSARTLTSYLLYPHIPSIRLNREVIRFKVGFSAWLFFLQIVRRLRRSLDRLLLGSVTGVVPLGLYQVGAGICQELITDVGRTSNSVVFPAIAQIQTHKQRVTAALARTLELAAVLTFVLCGLLYIYADQVIAIGFGEKWAVATEVLRISCVATMIHGVLAAANPILRGMGRSDLEFLLHFAVMPVILLAGVLLIPREGALGMAKAVLISEVALIPLWLWVLNRVIAVSTEQLVKTLSLPAILSLAVLLVGQLALIVFGPPASFLGLGIHLALPICLLAGTVLLFGRRVLPRNGDTLQTTMVTAYQRLHAIRVGRFEGETPVS